MGKFPILLAAMALAGTSAIAVDAAGAKSAIKPGGDPHTPAGWHRYPGDVIRITGEGLAFTQSGLHPARFIDFGLRREDVDKEVRRMRGAPTGRGRVARCRGGAMEFTTFGKLRLNYRKGRFVGWVLDEGAAPPV